MTNSKTPEYQRAWRAANPEKTRAYEKTQKAKKSERIKADRLARPEHYKARARRIVLRKYGLTPETYQQRIASQGGNCAACQTPLGTTTHIDHCHKKGSVRGILCLGCNVALGHVKDDPRRLQALIDYLGKCEDPETLL